MLSGLNLTFFSIRKRRFKIESKKNDAQALKDASGAAIPTYKIAGSTRKKTFSLPLQSLSVWWLYSE
jgi:hypothetical protein